MSLSGDFSMKIVLNDRNTGSQHSCKRGETKFCRDVPSVSHGANDRPSVLLENALECWLFASLCEDGSNVYIHCSTGGESYRHV